MNTKNLKTKSDLVYRNMPKINGNNQYSKKMVIGQDGGYSSVKCVTAGKALMFPSFAKRIPNELEAVIKTTDSFNYQYKNNITGEHWVVGSLAESMLDYADLEGTTDASIYGRYHYDSDMYKVIMSTGMGLSLYGVEMPDEIFLQTGLPIAYKDRDRAALVNALTGDYDFSIKIGTSQWQDFKFALDEKHIDVMAQPQGTLIGIGLGSGIDGKNVLTNNTIIYDLGFGTEDTFAIKSGFNTQIRHTYQDTAMKAMFELTIKYIQKDYPDVDVKVFEMQKYLESGQISYFDRAEVGIKYVNLESYMEKAEEELCKKSIQRLLVDYDNLIDYKYLIVTGGTGEARFERIKNMLAGLTTLTVLPGNAGDTTLPFTYSNAVGYYLFRQKSVTKKNESN